MVLDMGAPWNRAWGVATPDICCSNDVATLDAISRRVARGKSLYSLFCLVRFQGFTYSAAPTMIDSGIQAPMSRWEGPSRVEFTSPRIAEDGSSRRGRWLPVLILILLILLVSGSSLAQPAGDLRELSRTLEALSEQVRPAVVQIVATGYAAGQGVVPSSGALLSRQQGRGSGVILDPSGYVVTNAHVVANASRIQVELPLSNNDTDGRQSVLQPRGHVVGAQVVGVDQESDLAVLRIRVDRELTSLELGDSEALKPGELVMAFGSP